MTTQAAQLATDPTWIRSASDREAVDAGCYMDSDRAERPIRFIEKLIRVPHPKNPTRTTPLVLMDWQRDMADGRRRFRFAWVEIAKKNGKSTLAAALILYLLVADGEADPEIYSAATTREQAGIIYREAAKMVERSPALRRVIQARPHVKRLIYPRGSGFYTVLPNKPAAVDGINAHAIVFDELRRCRSF